MGAQQDRVASIFEAVVELATPAQQAAYLEAACGPDQQLRGEVEELLRHDDAAGGFLNAPARPDAGDTAEEPAAGERPGSAVGPYKLLEQIGEGGMGVVWMAEQTRPVRRKVALKMLKVGMDTRQVVARFEAERQALALMDHPNIAHVFDGGATTSGRPFFVLELVRGVPITAFCDQNHLGVRERLGLFVDVCQAVQHAHQKGIIHRDLKPSNVLVARHDDRAVVKVIDFGIAKATGQQLTEKTLFTNFTQMLGTPLYMSPEQAQMGGLDVDTRSDIYSLGVLLYELLTGTTPFDKERLRTAGYDEIRRIIREEEPARPSTRISTLGQAAATVSVNRQCDPKKLSRVMRGELDWIVMKALEKDRNRRYETASAFAADVQRYLSDEPVQACPPTTWYRSWKFVRRNKGPVLAGSVIALVLVAGVVGTTTGLVRALAAEGRTATERDDKEKARRETLQALNLTTDEVVEDLLEQPGVKLTDKRRDFLKKVLAYHEAFAAARADDPEGRQSRAQGYFRVGRIRHRLGDLRDAEAAYRDAVTQQKELVADFPTRPEFRQDLANSHARLGDVLTATQQPEEATAAYRAALPLWQHLATDFPTRPEFRQELANSQLHLGHQLRKTGLLEEAETAYRNAFKLRNQLVADFGPRPEFRADLAVNHIILGHLLYAAHRRQEADEAAHAGLVLYRQLIAEGPGSDRVHIQLRYHFAIITGDPTYFQYPHAPPGAGVRRPDAPEKLPEAERQSWQKLWTDVADMLQRAAEKTAPNN
jgi:serine/threonine protein kinase/tetratricopeptide (TPR) repeat protein